MKPGNPGHAEQKGEVLKRIHEQYGAPDQKDRDPVKKLGKDEFFKMMVNEMQHQDPMKPQDNKDMAAQMAQFSALEQMINVNQNIEKLAQAQVPLQQLGAASLIGKYVTADSSRFLHTEGKPSELKFELPTNAAKVRISIMNDKGETVQEIYKYDMGKGPVSVDWNGKRSNGMPSASGQYSIQVAAEESNGKPIPVQMAKTQVVSGVAFEGKETVLYAGDPKNPTKMLLKNVSRIIDPSQVGGAASAAAPAQPDNPFAAMLAAQGINIPGQEGNSEEGDEGNPMAAAAAGLGVGASANPYELDLAEDKQIGNFNNVRAGQFSPVNIPGMKLPGMQNEQNQGPQVPPASMREMEEANPAAKAMADGSFEKTYGAKPVDKDDLSGANPNSAKFSGVSKGAVRLDEIDEADSHSGNSLPSSQDGSIAGKLND